jgi:hypothetical protein
MGLDQWLYKRTYLLSGDWVKQEYRQTVSVNKGGNPDPKIKPEKIKYIIEEVGYWRKANAIHGWFVENVQRGKDDCGRYRVTREDLSKLLSLCNEVVENKDSAPRSLPTQSGFFFGGTDYDEWYYRDIEETIKIIEDCLSDDNAEEFEYTSSW